MFTEREKIIIENLVDQYISTGNAISSERLLTRSRLNCSTATIRKDLNNLESMGHIEGTHTSSGRIPTVTGYRYYIDNSLTRKPLSVEEQTAIKNLVYADADKNSIISTTTEFISEISDFASVIGSLDNDNEIDFLIFGINCHLKSYKLCWEINKKLNTNFIKTKNHPHPKKRRAKF